MTYLRVIPSFLASLLVVASAAAQTADGSTANYLPGRNEISMARSQYTQTADLAPDANDTRLAQLPRRGPGMPFPPQRGYPRESHPPAWIDGGNAGHALIGAAIGFGVGAAIGASGSDRSGTTLGGRVIIGGTIFAVIGGFIGGAHPWPHPRRVYRPSWPEDDEESDLRSHSRAKEGQPRQSVLARPASPSQPTGAEAIAPPSLRTAAIP